jgi:hypothetical protein
MICSSNPTRQAAVNCRSRLKTMGFSLKGLDRDSGGRTTHQERFKSVFLGGGDIFYLTRNKRRVKKAKTIDIRAILLV